MAERTIKMKSFVWHKKGKDYNDDDIVQVVQSKCGEVVDLPDNVIRYGENLGAFVTPEDEAQEEATQVDVATMGEDELVDWVSEATVPEIVVIAKNDPTLIGNLLAAENAATGNDPRTGVVEGLAIIAGGGAADDIPLEEGEVPTEETEGDDPDPAEVPETEEPTEEPTEETVDALAARLKVDVSEVEGSGEDDAVTADDVKLYYDEEMADATDGAIKLAEDKDVFLADVTGSGDGGRVSKDDVQKFLDAQGTAAE